MLKEKEGRKEGFDDVFGMYHEVAFAAQRWSRNPAVRRQVRHAPLMLSR